MRENINKCVYGRYFGRKINHLSRAVAFSYPRLNLLIFCHIGVRRVIRLDERGDESVNGIVNNQRIIVEGELFNAWAMARVDEPTGSQIGLEVIGLEPSCAAIISTCRVVLRLLAGIWENKINSTS